ncbi:MAG: hypothetical protein HY681_12130 [Chloroflexi bacterium]|nr:hypothetical protein [Chloroflexota bacterium]
MLNGFITKFMARSTESDFEAYCTSLQRLGLAGTPRIEEARREYQAILLSKAALSMV